MQKLAGRVFAEKGSDNQDVKVLFHNFGLDIPFRQSTFGLLGPIYVVKTCIHMMASLFTICEAQRVFGTNL